MQSMPLLLRQSLKAPGLSTLSRSTTTTATTATRPIRIPSAAPSALLKGNNELILGFSAGRRRQFHSHVRFYSQESERNNNVKEGAPASAPKESSEHNLAFTLPQEADVPKSNDVHANLNTESQQRDLFASGVSAENAQHAQRQGLDGKKDKDIESGNGKGGGLPSYLENRRSRYSKQFTEMMDNLQSNVFVAGQRLNDLTGYSSIEALKKEIETQEERLRAARRHVREAKDDYASAINRRSTSQREVNELLQRKHAWSASDLERFTHLYRNDHTNEVAEVDAQEALSKAEREAEESATKLSRSILSRYHEEQVWSDKIRRMSTWGTWGLMGVNVFLFLIFQIGVEPWRRKRLVKGFEEKVIEALEKEKALTYEEHQQQLAAATAAATATATAATQTKDSVQEQTSEIPASAATQTDQTYLDFSKSQLSHISPPSTTVDSWRRTLDDLLSSRTLILITQHDLTTVAVQSAAAGAAVMGLVIALIRPR
ncbi:putative mitochondrion biogenesis protein (She9) [Aspergillus ruber CBS 135680]|uniref:Sensitive to high expression protein 9, mitochondrial n=1 Tax=Aspergillus ruber (strain CBS 135680) TaxID=1388766 RepID=A0A017SFF2_ASPRC|nr:uncharacterized protein EURHEDRAFT_454832 [Aspergillus ruber CBS 135680]EYE95743.1 hypothetical protein EURHEDRAFT_454832 [Aspergillus ruber CBS 135680]